MDEFEDEFNVESSFIVVYEDEIDDYSDAQM